MARQQLYTCIDPLTSKPVTMPYPQTRAEAIAAGLAKYWPGTVCLEHNEQTVHFIKSGRAACCVHRGAVDAYNQAVVDRGEPATVADAQARGLDFYWSPMAFSKCGHYGKTTLKGTCYECKNARENSPRQAALRAGETWYTPDPDDLCPKCGQHARRRVANGSCEECEHRARPQTAESQPFYRQHPDMILSFEAAKSMGLNVYRTGEPCKFGHRGWRYVSTRGCLKCLGRD